MRFLGNLQKSNLVIENLSERTIFVSTLVTKWRGTTRSYNIRKDVEAHKTFNVEERGAFDYIAETLAHEDGRLPSDLDSYVSQSFDPNEKHRCIIVGFSTPDNPEIYYMDDNIGRMQKNSFNLVSTFLLIQRDRCDSRSYLR